MTSLSKHDVPKRGAWHELAEVVHGVHLALATTQPRPKEHATHDA